MSSTSYLALLISLMSSLLSGPVMSDEARITAIAGIPDSSKVAKWAECEPSSKMQQIAVKLRGRREIQKIYCTFGFGGDAARVVRDAKGVPFLLLIYSTHCGSDCTYRVLTALRIRKGLGLRNRVVLWRFLVPGVSVQYDYHLLRPTRGGLTLVLDRRRIRHVYWAPPPPGGWHIRLPPKRVVIDVKA